MSEPKVTRPHHGGAHHGANGAITRVVIHDEEYALSDTSAESIANYFAEPNHGDSCAHYVIDQNSEQHCGRDDELLYHAPPNTGSIGIERDGYASWDAKQWAQPAAQRTTCNVAARTAELCLRHHLPPVWLSVADVKAGKHGVTSHANVTAAFHLSTHTDPGPAFPSAAFMTLVVRACDEWKAGSKASVLDMGAWLDQSGDDDMANVMVPLPDNYPYKDHKPGDLVPLPTYLEIIGHQVFAIREVVQQDIAVDKQDLATDKTQK